MVIEKRILTKVGSPERLPDHAFGPGGATVRLMALAGNTGSIYVLDNTGGASKIDMLWEIAPGDVVSVHVNNLSEIYLLPATANDVIQWAVASISG